MVTKEGDGQEEGAIFRYKFTQGFMDELLLFSKVHQYDDRHGFKEAWSIWADTNAALIDGETSRLRALGYIGDIMDKMFKSARYYFRKKTTAKADPKARRPYLGVSKVLLDAMDKHVCEKVRTTHVKPADGFDEFCDTHTDILRDEIRHLLTEYGLSDAKTVTDKFKKTYKNRYFSKMKALEARRSS
jgi:hypothetical protein